MSVDNIYLRREILTVCNFVVLSTSRVIVRRDVSTTTDNRFKFIFYGPQCACKQCIFFERDSLYLPG